MLNQADLSVGLRNKLWTEAVRCANVLENISSTRAKEETPYELFMKKPSNLYHHLVKFGRIGYVTRYAKFKVNWKNCATRGIMVGYAESSSRDTYRLYMYETNHVIETRDVSWADWEPKTVKDKMPGMFGSDLEAEEN